MVRLDRSAIYNMEAETHIDNCKVNSKFMRLYLNIRYRLKRNERS